jgi:hypothetical protein
MCTELVKWIENIDLKMHGMDTFKSSLCSSISCLDGISKPFLTGGVHSNCSAIRYIQMTEILLLLCDYYFYCLCLVSIYLYIKVRCPVSCSLWSTRDIDAWILNFSLFMRRRLPWCFVWFIPKETPLFPLQLKSMYTLELVYTWISRQTQNVLILQGIKHW